MNPLLWNFSHLWGKQGKSEALVDSTLSYLGWLYSCLWMKEAKGKDFRCICVSYLVSLKWETQKESIENICLEDLNLGISTMMSYFHIK